MTGTELINLMKKANRRVHVTGTPENGVIKGWIWKAGFLQLLTEWFLTELYHHQL